MPACGMRVCTRAYARSVSLYIHGIARAHGSNIVHGGITCTTGYAGSRTPSAGAPAHAARAACRVPRPRVACPGRAPRNICVYMWPYAPRACVCNVCYPPPCRIRGSFLLKTKTKTKTKTKIGGDMVKIDLREIQHYKAQDERV
jgi:hypothetical protein